jgi:O-antigen/teichoic acid export membrane protein
MTISARKVAWDTGLSLGLNVAVRAAGTLIFIALGRLATTAEAGTFSLAMGYLAILTTLFVGLDDILVREIARRPERTWTTLATYGLIRIPFSLVAWAALLLVLGALSPYSTFDLLVLGVITGSILFDAVSALGQSVLNAHHQFGWPFVAVLIGSALELGIALFVVWRHAGLLAVAWAAPLGALLTAIILAGVLRRYLKAWPRPAKLIERGRALEILRLMPAFAGTSLLSGLEYQLDVILLSVLATHADVAQYSAAVTVMLIVLIFSQAYRVVLYPMLVRSLAKSHSQASQLVGRSLILMGTAGLLAAIVVSASAPGVINLLFGGRFEMAGPIVRVLIWNVVWFFLNVPLVRFMMAANGQATVFRVLLISLSVNLVANLVLIPRFGPLGPAYARLLSSGLFTAIMAGAVRRRLLRPAGVPAA